MVLCARLPSGRERPAPRWSKMTTRQKSRVEEAAMHRPGPGAGAAMQEQHRLAARVADLLPIHDVAAGQRQVAGLERSDLGEQVAAGHGGRMYQGAQAMAEQAARRDSIGAMQRFGSCFGALAGPRAVAMAAYAAHGLSDGSRPRRSQWCAARVQMQGWHALALVAVRRVGRGAAAGRRDWPGRRSLLGLLLFCGAVYVALGGVRLPGVAPAGGLLLIAGWALLGLSALRHVDPAGRHLTGPSPKGEGFSSPSPSGEGGGEGTDAAARPSRATLRP